MIGQSLSNTNEKYYSVFSKEFRHLDMALVEWRIPKGRGTLDFWNQEAANFIQKIIRWGILISWHLIPYTTSRIFTCLWQGLHEVELNPKTQNQVRPCLDIIGFTLIHMYWYGLRWNLVQVSLQSTPTLVEWDESDNIQTSPYMEAHCIQGVYNSLSILGIIIRCRKQIFQQVNFKT
jgi:hypothetical protein